MSMRKSSSAVAVTIIGLSLQYCGTEIRKRVTRYKQLILIGLLLLLPGINEFNAMVVSPLSSIFSEDESLIGSWAAAVFVVLSMLWAGLHRDAIAYPPAAAVMASLPISKQALTVRDLIVLALVSIPLLVLILAAFFMTYPLSHSGSGLLILLNVLLATAAAQLAVIRRATKWIPGAIAIAAITGEIHRPDVLIIMALATLLLLWRMPVTTPRKVGDYRQARFMSRVRRRAINGAELHWRSLYQSLHGAYRLCFVVSVVLTIPAATVLYKGNNTPEYDLSILLVHGALVSGLYGLSFPTIFSNQAHYQTFLNSLPMSRFRQAANIIVAVECPAVMLVLVLGAEVSCFASGWQIAAFALVVTVFLCCFQYFYK